MSRTPSLQGSLNHIATTDFLSGIPILLAVNQLILKQQSHFAYFRDDRLPTVYTRVSIQ